MPTKLRLLCLLTLLIPIGLQAQQQDKESRFTLGFAIGSGFSSHDNCYETGAYYKVGLVSGYRFSRFFSMESNLQFMHQDGLLYGYSNGTSFNLNGLQQWRNVNLTLGPALHLQARHGIEWSLTPKAGLMLNQTTQYIHNFDASYQARFYKPYLQAIYEGDLRISWWFTKGIAFEAAMGVFGAMNGDKALTTKKVSGYPNRNDNQLLPPAFLEDLTLHPGQMFAWNLNLGLRFRL